MAEGQRFRVAIGCQGGGSHTAFTAGVLQSLIGDRRVEVRALSGTSGGAVCAVAAWSGLVGRSSKAGRKVAAERLETIWQQNRTPWWAWPAETFLLASLRLGGSMGMSPEISAYRNPFEAHRAFLRLMDTVPFEELTPDRVGPGDPRLLISAVDVRTGEFRVFRSHRLFGNPPDQITGEVVLASAALPTVFRAVHLGEGVYWDGGFSQNPPLRELIPAARRDVPEGRLGAVEAGGGDPASTSTTTDLEPVELWVIQINPQTWTVEPTSMDDIRDRRNELSGNISYLQEIDAIAHMNRLILGGHLTEAARQVYAPVKVRVITMAADLAESLDYESKLARSPALIDRLLTHGRERGQLFLSQLASTDRDTLTALPNRDIWGRWTGRASTPA
ncbi:MAG: patatin-like phospholipase family protein [Kineosporiaceae bacterium]|nr:patatin-like phospholipase family protein [Kineosporiaceae bacterium]